MKTRLLVLGAALLAAGVAAVVVAQPPVAPKSRPVVGVRHEAAAPKSGPAPKLSGAGGLPVLGCLETRDRFIVIKAGRRGTVYSVHRKDGRVLHRSLSAQALRAKAPELYQLVKHGLAHPKKTGKVVIDASVSRVTAAGPGR